MGSVEDFIGAWAYCLCFKCEAWARRAGYGWSRPCAISVESDEIG